MAATGLGVHDLGRLHYFRGGLLLGEGVDHEVEFVG